MGNKQFGFKNKKSSSFKDDNLPYAVGFKTTLRQAQLKRKNKNSIVSYTMDHCWNIEKILIFVKHYIYKKSY